MSFYGQVGHHDTGKLLMQELMAMGISPQLLFLILWKLV
jgi:pentatricopeptide repeat protein